ncbi:hypothetical protein ACTXI9_16975 [Brachybacterium alimentarium]|uniref:hypothetical protein n=1 Tax=Brachybacterium alimentarium TaxID=47845 RepID=UPI003FD57765
MNTQTETDPTITVDYWKWSAVKGNPREPGVKIGKGEHYLFIEDRHLVATAEALIDYIAKNRDSINNNSN